MIHIRHCASRPHAVPFLLALLAVRLASPGTLLGWGEEGHVLITECTISKTPKEMPKAFRDQADWLGYLSTLPDRWRLYSDVLKDIETANHYLDMEALDTDTSKIDLPARRFQYLGHLRNLNRQAKDTGFLPYQIHEYYHYLRGALIEYRWAQEDPRGREFRSPTNYGSKRSVEMTCILYVGILAHYAEDASQPLHATIYYDGKGSDGKPARTGLHKRYEIDFVSQHVQKESLLPLVGAPRLIPDVLKEATRFLAESSRYSEDLLKFEAAGKLQAGDPEAVEFTRKRMAAGSQFLLDLWYTAWIQSEKSLPAFKASLAPKDD